MKRTFLALVIDFAYEHGDLFIAIALTVALICSH